MSRHLKIDRVYCEPLTTGGALQAAWDLWNEVARMDVFTNAPEHFKNAYIQMYREWFGKDIAEQKRQELFG